MLKALEALYNIMSNPAPCITRIASRLYTYIQLRTEENAFKIYVRVP